MHTVNAVSYLRFWSQRAVPCEEHGSFVETQRKPEDTGWIFPKRLFEKKKNLVSDEAEEVESQSNRPLRLQPSVGENRACKTPIKTPFTWCKAPSRLTDGTELTGIKNMKNQTSISCLSMNSEHRNHWHSKVELKKIKNVQCMCVCVCTKL